MLKGLCWRGRTFFINRTCFLDINSLTFHLLLVSYQPRSFSSSTFSSLPLNLAVSFMCVNVSEGLSSAPLAEAGRPGESRRFNYSVHCATLIPESTYTFRRMWTTWQMEKKGKASTNLSLRALLQKHIHYSTQVKYTSPLFMTLLLRNVFS